MADTSISKTGHCTEVSSTAATLSTVTLSVGAAKEAVATVLPKTSCDHLICACGEIESANSEAIRPLIPK